MKSQRKPAPTRGVRAVSPKRYDSEGDAKGTALEEVYSNKSRPRKNTLLGDKHKTNRSTYFRPSITDFSQLTEFEKPTDNYQNVLREQFGLEPSVPERGKTLRDVFRPTTITTQNDSQYAAPTRKSQVLNRLESQNQWQNIDYTAESDNILRDVRTLRDAEPQSIAPEPIAPRVRIAEAPRVRVIAEKFSKFKRNNIELRKLEEKVVCLEYDVFRRDSEDEKPFQKMRAFFMIKPRRVKENVNETMVIPPEVKGNFNVDESDFDQLDKKEIEIIDGKIPDNRSLLEDLKKVLRRKQAIEHKKKQDTLDLDYMYQMAKRESPPLDEDYSRINMLSKAELEEIKDLILKKCASSVHGIRRRTVTSEFGDSMNSAYYISNCLAAELMREEKDI